jgi:hypothetical protein
VAGPLATRTSTTPVHRNDQRPTIARTYDCKHATRARQTKHSGDAAQKSREASLPFILLRRNPNCTVRIPLNDDRQEKANRIHQRQALHDAQRNSIRASATPNRHRLSVAANNSPHTPANNENDMPDVVGTAVTPMKRNVVVPLLANFEEWMKLATDNVGGCDSRGRSRADGMTENQAGEFLEFRLDRLLPRHVAIERGGWSQFSKG